MTPKQKAQQGKELIKEAVLELLASKRGTWLSRSTIEDSLGIGSDYKGGGGAKSYEGGLAAMILSELCEKRKVRREKDSDGQTWLYTIV